MSVSSKKLEIRYILLTAFAAVIGLVILSPSIYASSTLSIPAYSDSTAVPQNATSANTSLTTSVTSGSTNASKGSSEGSVSYSNNATGIIADVAVTAIIGMTNATNSEQEKSSSAESGTTGPTSSSGEISVSNNQTSIIKPVLSTPDANLTNTAISSISNVTNSTQSSVTNSSVTSSTSQTISSGSSSSTTSNNNSTVSVILSQTTQLNNNANTTVATTGTTSTNVLNNTNHTSISTTNSKQSSVTNPSVTPNTSQTISSGSSSSTTSNNNRGISSPTISLSKSRTTIMLSSFTSSDDSFITDPVTAPLALSVATDRSYYAYGDVATLKFGIPGRSLQNIAIGVSDPSGTNIISRTVTTNENGTGLLQFRIPDRYQTGIYQGFATALVDSKNYTNSTKFTVVKSHGIAIDSVQVTDQQGNTVSMLKKGQNNFVKISFSSDEKIPTLITLNLFDSNQSSLGTGSIKSVVNPGKDEMSLSFFIPPNAQLGSASIFTNAFSDWPVNGGTPLTKESCLAVSIEESSVILVSSEQNLPHECAKQVVNAAGTALGKNQLTWMTNDQAVVTLGVEIQNDSMTFMDPAKARLLSLAYNDDKAPNKENKSIVLVSVNLDNMSSTNSSTSSSSANVTKVGPAQFTTLAGPALLNDPMALKILKNIEISKKQVANILAAQKAAELEQKLVKEQRLAAADKLKQDLVTLAEENAPTTPNAAFARFLSTVSNDSTKSVFEGQFDFTKNVISVAKSAMQNALNKGASLEEAIQVFNKYAAISRAQLVEVNKNLNVKYALADSRVQSCFDGMGRLTVIDGVNPCVANLEYASSEGISIISVQPSDQAGNPVSLFHREQNGFIKVVVHSSVATPSLVTINLFDSNLSSLGTTSVKYTLSSGTSEVVLPYYVPAQSATGLAGVHANIFTDWPNKGGISQSNELSYFVGLL